MDYRITLLRVPSLAVGDVVLPLRPVGILAVDEQRLAGEIVSIHNKILWVKFPSDPDLSFEFRAGELEKVS